MDYETLTETEWERVGHVWDLLDHHEADLAIGGRPPASAATLATRDENFSHETTSVWD